MTDVNLESLLAEVDGDVTTELASKPDVVDKGHQLDVDDLPIVARRWHKLRDAVAVVADLKSSTQLSWDPINMPPAPRASTRRQRAAWSGSLIDLRSTS
jgi:hypothetical protein